MPEYRKVDHEIDSRVLSTKYPKVPDTDIDNWRQPVHVVEHELYAIPGDAIALYPFYELANDYRYQSPNTPNRYALRFAHWYNYRTGGNVTTEDRKTDVLDFLVDPSLICKSENYGYYGGMAISRYTKTDPTAGSGGDTPPVVVEALEISTIDGYLDFMEAVNGGTHNAAQEVKLTADLDFASATDEQKARLTSIGSSEKPFQGTFDGQGHIISNLTISKPTETNVGMFGYIGTNSVIRNIIVENGNFEGLKNVGFIGYTKSGVIIENLLVSAQIKTNTNEYTAGPAGLIVGLFETPYDGKKLTIKNCGATGSVTGLQGVAALGCLASVKFQDWNDEGKIKSTAEVINCFVIADIKDEKADYEEREFAFQSNLQDGYTPNKYSNCYSNVFSQKDLEKGLAKMKEVDGEYQTEDGIAVNTDEFANLLNGGKDGEWFVKIYEDGTVRVCPFKSLEPKEPGPTDPDNPEDPEVKNKPTDEVVGLDRILDQLYKGTGKGYDPRERGTANFSKLYDMGAVATFFYPRTTNAEGEGKMENLGGDPMASGVDNDYLIAADFANIFQDTDNPKLNIDSEGNKINEPQITFRHIFRIKDGKEFAEKFAGSPENNKKYIRENRRVITARKEANKFQIRLDCPVPRYKKDGKNFCPPSKYYYKISDTDYRRVRSSRIEVYKADKNGNVTDYTDINGNGAPLFDYGDDFSNFPEYNGFEGYGKRVLEETEYLICGGGGEYYRMVRGTNLIKGTSIN